MKSTKTLQNNNRLVKQETIEEDDKLRCKEMGWKGHILLLDSITNCAILMLVLALG